MTRTRLARLVMLSMISVLAALSVMIDNGVHPVQAIGPTGTVVAVSPNVRALVDAYMKKYNIWQSVSWNYSHYPMYYDYVLSMDLSRADGFAGIGLYLQDALWRSHLDDFFALLRATDVDVLTLERSRRLALWRF